MNKTRYQIVADSIKEGIETGLYPMGQKLPGTRKLANLHQVSINTVLQAQKVLENQGLISAVPRSGYFVQAQYANGQAPSSTQTVCFTPAPALMNRQQLVLDLIQASRAPGVAPLGVAVPHGDFFPSDNLRIAHSRALRRFSGSLLRYETTPGNPKLRSLLCDRFSQFGLRLTADDLVITSGCQEANVIALRAVTQPGDLVAVESPSYYGLLQALDSLHLKVLEIPTRSEGGMDLEAFKVACEQWPVKALILVGNFSNPMGGTLALSDKKQLIDYCNQRDMPIIEDDIYGELAHDGKHPTTLKSLDTQGLVLYCGSFSKTISPGVRLGWLAAGKYTQRVSYMKSTLTLASPSLAQAALAIYLEQGDYLHHLRRVQAIYRQNISKSRQFIEQRFPEGTGTSAPLGGFVLWVELPETIDAQWLYQQALKEKVSIAPGHVFTTSDRYGHCFRLNCAQPWAQVLKPSLEILAAILASHQQPCA